MDKADKTETTDKAACSTDFQRVSELIAYLRALAELKKSGHHVTLEIKSTMEAIEREFS